MAPSQAESRFQALSARPSSHQRTSTYTYLKDLVKTTASVPGRASNRSASNNDLVIQRTRLKLGERAFSVAAPRIWNQLPSDLKATTDTVAFKRKLKTYLFSAAYNQ